MPIFYEIVVDQLLANSVGNTLEHLIDSGNVFMYYEGTPRDGQFVHGFYVVASNQNALTMSYLQLVFEQMISDGELQVTAPERFHGVSLQHGPRAARARQVYVAAQVIPGTMIRNAADGQRLQEAHRYRHHGRRHLGPDIIPPSP